jgi:hypothetical protein
MEGWEPHTALPAQPPRPEVLSGSMLTFQRVVKELEDWENVAATMLPTKEQHW